MRRLIEKNVYVSYKQIKAELSLFPASIHAIIHTHLKMQKIASRWVSWKLTDSKKKGRRILTGSGEYVILSLRMSPGAII